MCHILDVLRTDSLDSVQYYGLGFLSTQYGEACHYQIWKEQVALNIANLTHTHDAYPDHLKLTLAKYNLRALRKFVPAYVTFAEDVEDNVVDDN